MEGSGGRGKKRKKKRRWCTELRFSEPVCGAGKMWLFGNRGSRFHCSARALGCIRTLLCHLTPRPRPCGEAAEAFGAFGMALKGPPPCGIRGYQNAETRAFPSTPSSAFSLVVYRPQWK